MEQPPFHDPNREPLPDANDVEAEFRRPDAQWQQNDSTVDLSAKNRDRLEADKRWMRNLIIGLLIGGLAIGGLLAVGLVWGLGRLNMIDPPATNPAESVE